VNGQPAAVVGVTPPGFFGLDRGVSPDVTVPLPARSPFTNLGVTRGRSRARPTATRAPRRMPRCSARSRSSLRGCRSIARRRGRRFWRCAPTSARPTRGWASRCSPMSSRCGCCCCSRLARVVLLALAGCAAGYLRANRAARLEPAAALRRE